VEQKEIVPTIRQIPESAHESENPGKWYIEAIVRTITGPKTTDQKIYFGKDTLFKSEAEAKSYIVDWAKKEHPDAVGIKWSK